MVSILALDIGGANIKALRLEVDSEGKICDLKTLRFYWPIWRLGKESLRQGLEKVRKELGKSDHVVVTMTAELSDVFYDKIEGVTNILKHVEKMFPNAKILTVDGKLVSFEEALKNTLSVASANWYATGYLGSKFRKNCIVIDIGSTTTSIIPIVKGKVYAIGKNDVEKLALGELVYTGVLRTNLTSIVDTVPLRGSWVRVSSELFALTGDVYRVLGMISSEDYTTETANGRGRSLDECIARISRLVCGDLNILTYDDVKLIAKYVHYKQVSQVAEALWQVCSRIKGLTGELSAIVTGLGKDILARKACEIVGIKEILGLDELVGFNISPVAPCLGLALMYLDEIKVDVVWT